jgi:hypothetical protein
VKQLARGEADALPADLDEAALASEIIAVSLPLTMLLSVVLVNSSSTDQPQIGPRDEAAPTDRRSLSAARHLCRPSYEGHA